MTPWNTSCSRTKGRWGSNDRLAARRITPDLWEALTLRVYAFGDLALDTSSSDRVVWSRCQQDELVLITANRNAQDDDSLELVIRELNQPSSLPVITISNPPRIFRDTPYAHDLADRLLEYLFDIDNYRGAGRLSLP